VYDPSNGSISSDLNLDFKVTALFRPIDSLNVLYAQLTRDLFAIAKFWFTVVAYG